MAEFYIQPQSGTLQQAKSVKFHIDNLDPQSDYTVEIENATLRSNCLFGNDQYEKLFVSERQNISGEIDLNMPDYCHDMTVSLFANIYRKGDDDYVLSHILSEIYTVMPSKSVFDGNVSLSPSFLSTSDKSVLKLQHEPNSRIVVDINGRQFVLITDANGHAERSIYGRDIQNDPSVKVIRKFPVEILTAENNYTSKYFSGSFLHLIPDELTMYASSTDDDLVITNTSMSPQIGNQPRPNDNMPQIPQIGSDSSDCADITNLPSNYNVCRIVGHASTKLPNGLITNAVLSIDSDETDKSLRDKNRVFLYNEPSSSKVLSFDIDSIVVTQLGDELLALVQKDIYDRVQSGDELSFYADDEYKVFEVLEKRMPDEYIDLYQFLLDGSMNDGAFEVCVKASAHRSGSELSSTALDKLPYIYDDNDNPAPIISMDIGSSDFYVINSSDHYLYVIAEALINDRSQLFLYGIYLNSGGDEKSYSIGSTSGWHQLTSDANNSNPTAYVDKMGNLHVAWESDRLENQQIYYSVVGPGSVSTFNAALVSQVDKEAQLFTDGFNLYTSIVDTIKSAKDIGLEQSCFDEYIDNRRWFSFETHHGISDPIDNNTINVQGNPYKDEAISFVKLDRNEDGSKIGNKYDYLNYGISFDLLANFNTTRLEKEDINDSYKEWLSQFNQTKTEEFNRLPLYEKAGNEFLVERNDRVFDRFIPLVGSYKNELLSDRIDNCETHSNDTFRAVAIGDNATLRHFMVGLMPEKSIFTATNRQSLDEFCVSGNLDGCQDDYIPQLVEEHYTGRYQLFVVMNAENDYYGSPRHDNNISISRMIGKPFYLDSTQHFDIVVHYGKMYSEDVKQWLENPITSESNEIKNRFICSLNIARNDESIFGESFLVNLGDEYNEFDIGFGFPAEGGYASGADRPYATSIYEDIDTDFDISDIRIGIPQYKFNTEAVTVPDNIRKTDKIYNATSIDINTSETYLDYYSLLNFGLDNNNFPQVPITRLGYNTGIAISEGFYNSDLHFAWQSNRDKQWDIYYATTVDRGLPLRHEIQITNSLSNSKQPDLVARPDGRLFVTWHDDRDGYYQIYSATSNKIATDKSDCDRAVIEEVAVISDDDETSGDDGTSDDEITKSAEDYDLCQVKFNISTPSCGNVDSNTCWHRWESTWDCDNEVWGNVRHVDRRCVQPYEVDPSPTSWKLVFGSGCIAEKWTSDPNEDCQYQPPGYDCPKPTAPSKPELTPDTCCESACWYRWESQYDCSSDSWGDPTHEETSCRDPGNGDEEPKPTEWSLQEPNTCIYEKWVRVVDESCSSDSDCPSNPDAPNKPQETPEHCCESCPPEDAVQVTLQGLDESACLGCWHINCEYGDDGSVSIDTLSGLNGTYEVPVNSGSGADYALYFDMPENCEDAPIITTGYENTEEKGDCVDPRSDPRGYMFKGKILVNMVNCEIKEVSFFMDHKTGCSDTGSVHSRPFSFEALVNEGGEQPYMLGEEIPNFKTDGDDSGEGLRDQCLRPSGGCDSIYPVSGGTAVVERVSTAP